MTARLASVLRSLRRPWIAFLVLAALAGGGYGVLVASRFLEIELRSRAAERYLEQSDHTQRRANLSLARAELSRCLDLCPDNGRIHFLAGRTARQLGDSEDAERHLSLARKNGWVEEAIDLEQALLRAQQGDLKSVEGVLLSFVQRDHPDKPRILEALARGYLGTYQLFRALACLDRWVEIQPDNPQALLWRGQTLLLLDRHNAALADYRRVVELDSDEDEGGRKLAEVLLSSHQAAEALPYFTRWRERQPSDTEAILGLARCQAELSRTETAIGLLDELLTAEPKQAAALALRGKLALQAGQFTEAERWLRLSLAEAPFERETVFNLAQCLQALDRTEDARKYWTKLERIDADRARLKELRTAIQKAPDDAALRYEMGSILLRNGQDREGLRWLDSALKADPRHGPTHAALADHYEKAGNRRLASYHRQQTLSTARDGSFHSPSDNSLTSPKH
jgi:tetratricopeptide (TPR) repeat protein